MKAALKTIRIYVKTVELGSMSRAATALGISTSGVSQQIRRLEQEMAVSLLHRNTRRFTLTEAGELLYQHGVQLMQTLVQAERDIDSLKKQPFGSLRLFTPVGFAGSGILSKPLKHLLTHYKHLNIDIKALDEEIDMVAEQIDVALRISSTTLPDSSLIARHLADWQTGLFVAPDYLTEVGPVNRVEDLDKLDRLQHCNENYPTLPFSGAKIQLNNMQAMTRLTVDGLGYALLPVPETDQLVAAGQLQRLLPDMKLPTLSIYALTTHRAPHPAKISAALEALEKSFRQYKANIS